MYSPKIREDLVPRIHHAAKEAKLPMTDWVNQAVEQRLRETAQPETERKEDSHEYVRDRSNRPAGSP